jgi:2,3-bisphosphoglycerate-independent phosphoglycerate mutase
MAATLKRRPVVLMVLDGFGLSPEHDANAVYMAKTPNLDRMMAECPFQQGFASGMAVGLPDGQMGNSEVGHMNIGSGRIIYQDLTLITKHIQDGVFFKNEELLHAINNCKEKGSDLHIWGLLSDGGVHSHNTHLYAILELCKREGLERVYIHPFFDGRDTPPASGKDYLQALVDEAKKIGVGKVASLHGRYYAMDRDNNWDRIQKAYDALVLGEGNKGTDPVEAMQASYDAGVTDEFVVPTVLTDEAGSPIATVKPNDSVIFFNFRPDRAREITKAFCFSDEDIAAQGGDPANTKSIAHLKRAKGFIPLTYVCFKDYDETIPNKFVAFKKEEIKNTFGEFLANNGLKQLRLAETEKYAHVTFFFNGGIEEPNPGEDRILVNSPAVATYDLQPEMSAPEVSAKLNAAIVSGEYDVIVINFANPDMVGHTGVLSAAITAVERVDEFVGSAEAAVKQAGGVLFICADHGNAEQMVNHETGQPHTAHTTNPVPFILVNYDDAYTLREGGKLCDIAPTLIEIMGLEKPAEMTGESLLVKKA